MARRVRRARRVLSLKGLRGQESLRYGPLVPPNRPACANRRYFSRGPPCLQETSASRHGVRFATRRASVRSGWNRRAEGGRGGNRRRRRVIEVPRRHERSPRVGAWRPPTRAPRCPRTSSPTRAPSSACSATSANRNGGSPPSRTSRSPPLGTRDRRSAALSPPTTVAMSAQGRSRISSTGSGSRRRVR
jgi:hypothetical protein